MKIFQMKLSFLSFMLLKFQDLHTTFMHGQSTRLQSERLQASHKHHRSPLQVEQLVKKYPASLIPWHVVYCVQYIPNVPSAASQICDINKKIQQLISFHSCVLPTCSKELSTLNKYLINIVSCSKS